MPEFNEEEYYNKIANMLYSLVKENNMNEKSILLFTNYTIKRTYEIAIENKDIITASKFNKIYKSMNNGRSIEEDKEIIDILEKTCENRETNYRKIA